MKTANQELREQLAHRIEQNFVRAAGVIRNRIVEGMNFDQACVHESVLYYIDLIEKNKEEISRLD